MTLVKFCGIKTIEEARAARNLGAWAIGEVFAPSPRRLSVEAAARLNHELPVGPLKVGVFVNEKLSTVLDIIAACRLDMVQLHGDESPEYLEEIHIPVIKSFPVNGPIDLHYVRQWRARAYLFDTGGCCQRGGSGQCFDWGLLAQVKTRIPVILAGGLSAENVSQAIQTVRPDAVDVSSGVEYPQGGKNIAAMRRFMEAAKNERDTLQQLGG